MYVTRISRYVQRSVLSVVSRNRGWSWNVLPVHTGVLLYSKIGTTSKIRSPPDHAGYNKISRTYSENQMYMLEYSLLIY
jgi:hypothetical protein